MYKIRLIIDCLYKFMEDRFEKLGVMDVENSRGDLTLQVKFLRDNAKLPTKGTLGSAGYDLYACLNEPLTLRAKGRALIPTGIAMTIPIGYFGRIAPRSSLAVKGGIDVGAGIIDSDYRDAVGVVLFNHSDSDYVIEHGDRIAQMIIIPCASPLVVQADDLAKSDRKGGFGSTGR